MFLALSPILLICNLTKLKLFTTLLPTATLMIQLLSVLCGANKRIKLVITIMTGVRTASVQNKHQRSTTCLQWKSNTISINVIQIVAPPSMVA